MLDVKKESLVLTLEAIAEVRLELELATNAEVGEIEKNKIFGRLLNLYATLNPNEIKELVAEKPAQKLRLVT